MAHNWENENDTETHCCLAIHQLDTAHMPQLPPLVNIQVDQLSEAFILL